MENKKKNYGWLRVSYFLFVAFAAILIGIHLLSDYDTIMPAIILAVVAFAVDELRKRLANKAD